MVVLTGSYRFYVISDLYSDTAQFRMMHDVPGLDAPPSSWAVLPQVHNVNTVLVKLANERDL